MKRTAPSLCLFCALCFAVGCASEDAGDSDASLSASPTHDAASPSARADAASDAGVSGTDAASPADAAVRTDSATSPAASDGGTRLDASTSGQNDASTSDADTDANDAGGMLEKFSFFVTSLQAMRQLSGSQDGFGGDLRYGETGDGAGLRGADKICADVAELGMPGAKAKTWRAFLSTTTVDARDRIGAGPWYDRAGRLVAQNLNDLLQTRPQGGDPTIRDDLPNERGEPNHEGSAEGSANDNHDVVTGTGQDGRHDGGNTCSDWTSTSASGGGGGMSGPRLGHSWPARSGSSWTTAHSAPGCAPSVSLVEMGAGSGSGIGNGGGYGGIYCFALTP